MVKLKPSAVKYLVVHCSATPPKSDIGVKEIDLTHRQAGFFRCGYHYVIRRDGTVEKGRSEDECGIHVKGYNVCSLGICLVGGINKKGKAENNFTEAQFKTLKTLLEELHARYPNAVIQGHRDFSPDKNKNGVVDPWERIKECPCFDVKVWWQEQKGESGAKKEKVKR